MTDQPISPGTDPRTAELERRIADLERRSPTRMMQQGRSGLEEAFWAVMHNMFPEEARMLELVAECCAAECGTGHQQPATSKATSNQQGNQQPAPATSNQQPAPPTHATQPYPPVSEGRFRNC